MDNIIKQIEKNELVAFIGMGVFKGTSLPYDSDSFILSVNGGKPMPPRLMYEYTRAFMNIEQKRGRQYLENLVKNIYEKDCETPKIYEILSNSLPKYAIDINIDNSLQRAYSKVPHFLITGKSRVLGDGHRFDIYFYDGKSYTASSSDKLNDSAPILFKPMGAITPSNTFVISDADFVDWLTEAMGGYAVPAFLKEYRKNKEYIFIGVDFTKDTFRMVANEVAMDLKGGIYLTKEKELSKKVDRFIKNHNLKVVSDEI